MRATQILAFQQSPVAALVRPWKKFRDGTLFYGLTKTGSRRHPLTTKKGNKNFYKGTRSSGIGRLTTKARYVINWDKVRTFVVPKEYNFDLKPLVSPNAPQIQNHYEGFQKGPLDPQLFYKKLREYVFYGKVETQESQLKEGYLERG
ncbi:54S ribosomal protein L27, mitochondrial [Wickerhamomyces ciferrii]|uniref:54S ribosomal protein L27, mitochondrial n=1 Tax=Wickerhamomyces ciferrii (strain ATCC 14091 / BCRC 22168 / CBS 111 / JCM 3599 / NBRC 0793 / NRRL Y-1031 F-60-10) TaxID=1206466 RepID=K0K837_WICCF|nr:54S ribosomal protein L27, mitochondrial [Wickerhamomyces ciferrii]CCH40985.1 54S ribosomal protein L27, mitochondrial [Wickerhamomyces ciferrii]